MSVIGFIGRLLQKYTSRVVGPPVASLMTASQFSPTTSSTFRSPICVAKRCVSAHATGTASPATAQVSASSDTAQAKTQTKLQTKPPNNYGTASPATAQIAASSDTAQTTTPNNLQVLEPAPQTFSPKYVDMDLTFSAPISDTKRVDASIRTVSELLAELRKQFDQVTTDPPSKEHFSYLVIEAGSGFGKTRLGAEITKRLFDGVPGFHACQLFVNANRGIGATKSGVYSDGEAWLIKFLKEQKHVPAAVTDFEGALCALADQSGKKSDDWCVLIMQIDEFQNQPKFAASLIRASYTWNFSHLSVKHKFLLLPIATGLSQSLFAQGQDISPQPTASFFPHVWAMH